MIGDEKHEIQVLAERLALQDILGRISYLIASNNPDMAQCEIDLRYNRFLHLHKYNITKSLDAETIR